MKRFKSVSFLIQRLVGCLSSSVAVARWRQWSGNGIPPPLFFSPPFVLVAVLLHTSPPHTSPPHLSSTSPFASSLSKAASLLARRCFSPHAALFRFFPSCRPPASVFGPFPAPCALSVSHLFALRVTSGLL